MIKPTQQPPVVFSIAGSDPSGGAGIQADIKTISALRGYAAAAITAVTSQNTYGVQGVYPLPPEVVQTQIASVMDDLRPVAVKIGMVYSLPLVEVIAEAIAHYHPQFVVYDPVMISTSGRRLMTEETVQGITQLLFPRCTLITPNLDEASMLLAHPLKTPEEMELGGQQLATRYGCHVLVKGGHLSGETMCDVLCSADATFRFSSPKSTSHNLHGTGCTLSSAIATLLAHGHPMEQAVEEAKQYICCAIEGGKEWHIGHGNGPLCHFFQG